MKGKYVMKITVLMEDTCGLSGCIYEHGLSIYTETDKHKILIDTGASGAFIENAHKLGIDLTQVDTVIISHGHYDHTGGVMDLAKMIPDADIYMQENAAADYYHNERYIGIDKHILTLPQLRAINGDWEIDSELSLMTNIKGRRLWPQSNFSLKKKINGSTVQDEFDHEQCLVITAESVRILFSGCAHNGILNILDNFKEKYGTLPDAVISGFHMMKKGEYTTEEIGVIKETAQELKKTGIIFYTGHCTGQAAFDIMHEIMEYRLISIHSGMEICLQTLNAIGF